MSNTSAPLKASRIATERRALDKRIGNEGADGCHACKAKQEQDVNQESQSSASRWVSCLERPERKSGAEDKNDGVYGKEIVAKRLGSSLGSDQSKYSNGSEAHAHHCGRHREDMHREVMLTLLGRRLRVHVACGLK